MAISDRVTSLVRPILDELGLRLYDVEVNGGILRVTVDRDGGVDLDQLAAATRLISAAFDDHDPMPGAYTLEVSSPGLERRLRTAEHFVGAVGEVISVKLGPHVDGERRLRGELRQVDGEDIVIVSQGQDRRVGIADITKAVTVFEWEREPKPGSPEARKAKNESERRARAR